MLREARKVAPTYKTIWGRLASLRGIGHRPPEWPQSFSHACPALAACDSRDRAPTVRRNSCRQNAAYEKCGSSHDTSNGLGARVFRPCGDRLKDVYPTVAKSLAQADLVLCPSLPGVSCTDDERTPSTRIHGCSPMLAESFYGNKYFTQTRNYSSVTNKAIQADKKKAVDKKAVDSGNKDNRNDNPNEKRTWFTKSVTLLSDLEHVPVAALGLGLAGAIPFVGLSPGIASILPLPDCLYNVHMEAQAAYGAVILTFLGGPHWGLAMSGNGESPKSGFSKISSQTMRYVWSVIPSLVAWPALLLDPIPKLVVLITSYGLVLGVDAFFARIGLLPHWFLPLRILLTSIAMLSMASTLIVTAALNAAAAVTT